MRDTIFRLFVSSTFADFQHERRALHQRVFPLLDAHCRKRGARFEVVDLRWGISPEAQEDHTTLAICLAEIDRSRRIGMPPNFVILLGDRYGWEPPPAEIAAASWLRILAAAGEDVGLLNGHYVPDRNAVPPVWRLRQLASAIDAAGLVAALRRSALSAGLLPGDHPEIFASATHQEVARGVFSLQAGTADAFAYVREIDGLPFSMQGAPYVDLVAGEWDSAAHQRLQALKQTLAGYLAPGQVRHFSTHWHGTDIDTVHLDGFCAQFLADQMALIDRSLASVGIDGNAATADSLHESFARERARLFVGREQEVDRIAGYAGRSEHAEGPDMAPAPLVVIGEGGTGKSALLARCAQRLKAGDNLSIVFARFVGAVPGSEDLTELLGDLAAGISAAYDRTPDRLPTGFDAASAAFQRALTFASDARPLVIFLDALDQLSSTDQLHLLDWLPDKLPNAARVVVSVREGRIATEARRRFPRSVIRLLPMAIGDSTAMLDRLLADAGRCVTADQRALINDASPGLPLWTRLAFEEVRHWRSTHSGRPLEPTIEGLILARIADLARPAAHGAALVNDTLGAIAAARSGLSDSELAEALSRENAPAVWVDFRRRSFYRWDEPQLPPILWFRLYADLAPYLAEQRTDGALTYRFFHREFYDVVAREYLTGTNGIAMHRRLARVFAEPAGAGLYLACDVTRPQSSAALRRIMEQPWQLAAAGEHTALAALIDDVSFVLAKCAANRVSDLMQDIAEIANANAEAAVAGSSASWRARLLAWRQILAQADANWPAHRILFQLLIEADLDWPQRAAALALLKTHPPDWTVLVSATRQRYLDPPVATVPAPPRVSGIAPLSSRVIAAWDDRGSLRLTDRVTGNLLERVELGSTERVAGVLDTLANELGLGHGVSVFAVPNANDRRRSVSLEVADPPLKLSWQWSGCLAIKQDEQRTELIIGKEDILFLGATERELFFLADGRITIAAKQTLAKLEPGLFSFNGQRIGGLAIAGDEGGWTHERFNSVVFIDGDTCLTLGFSLGGIQRDDVILEIYRITEGGVSRHASGGTDHDLDLPIWHVVGLSNGSVVFASERYWHTFEWAPPFEGECEVTMIPGAAVGSGSLGNWVNTGDEQGHLTFAPKDPAVAVTFDAPGFYGSEGGECYTPDGVTRLDPDDFVHTGTDFAGIEVEDMEGRITRWCTDVRPHWIFERDSGDFVVFKNSGPVRVAPWERVRAQDAGLLAQSAASRSTAEAVSRSCVERLEAPWLGNDHAHACADVDRQGMDQRIDNSD